MSIFEQFMRGRQFAQQQALNQMRLAQAEQLFPIEQQLKNLQLERARQDVATGQRKQESESAILAGRLAERALGETDPDVKDSIIRGGISRLGLDIDPATVTDEQLQQMVIQKDILAPVTSKFEQGKGEGMQGMTFNTSTGAYSINQSARNIALKTQNELANKKSFTLKDVDKINNSVTALTKDARGIKSATDSLSSLEESASPAAKLAAVFKFMKALDPQSVVRETEQGQVYESQGVPAQLLGVINNITGEGKLTGAAFSDLVNTSKVMANAALQSARDETVNYLDVYPELSQSRRASIEKRVPQVYEIDEDTQTQVKNLTPMAKKYQSLSPQEKQRLAPMLTDEERQELGIPVDQGFRRGRNAR